jgi:hypothetical protein
MANGRDRIPEKGERDHEAEGRYREATRRFNSENDPDAAAREAEEALLKEQEELEAAGAAGRARVADEDPEVKKGP